MRVSRARSKRMVNKRYIKRWGTKAMPCQKEIDAGKKMPTRGPCTADSKWQVLFKGATEWVEICGDSADTALRSVGKNFSDIQDIKSCGTT